MRARRLLPHAIGLIALAMAATAPMAAAAAPAAGIAVINTVAGSGEFGYSGDGGPATEAKLWGGGFVAADPSGGFYFTDFEGITKNKHTIRKVDNNKNITTIAGEGTQQPSKNAIPASESSLFRPMDIVSDGHGIVYIADTKPGNLGAFVYKMYKDDAGKDMITTVAGGGATPEGQARSATDADFRRITGLAVSETKLYIAGRFHVWEVDLQHGTMVVKAGNGEYEKHTPEHEGKEANKVPVQATGVAVDGSGNIFVGGSVSADQNRLRVISSDNKIRTVACGGTSSIYDGIDAKDATCAPESIAVGRDGKPYFLGRFGRDESDSVVLTLDLDQGKIRVVAGIPGKAGYDRDGGKATEALLDEPEDVTVDDSGDLYITDSDNNRVRKVSPQKPPVAKDDSATTDSGKPVTIEVLTNDEGIDLTISDNTEPGNGEVTKSEDGKFTYKPKAGFAGTDSFTYTVSDNLGQTAPAATVKVTVKAGSQTTTTTTPPAGNGGGNGGGSGGGQPPVVQPVNASHNGGLPKTGASVVGLMAAAGALLAMGGALVAVTRRRRRARG